MRRLTPWALAVIPCMLALLASTGCTPVDNGGTNPGGVGTSIEVRSQPSGAHVFLDGADTGRTTPTTLTGLTSTATGSKHAVGLDLAGYYTYGTVVTLYSTSARSASTVSAQLTRDTTAGGDVYVQTSPVGATVYLDGQNTGEVTPVTLTDVGPTSHSVEVALSGYDRRQETVTVTGGKESSVELMLTRTGRSAVSGSVYDKVHGGLLSGATITIDGTTQEAQTTQQGSYHFENLTKGYYDLVAEKRLSDNTLLVGRRENVYVDPTNGRNMTADIVMATQAEMGSVRGRVLDHQDRAIANAYVYLDMSNAVYFTPVDEGTGEFRFPDVPRTPSGKQYRLVASAPGFANGASAATVTAGNELALSLRLDDGVTGTPLKPLVDWSQALTYPTAEETYQGGILAVRRLIADKATTRREQRLALIDRLAEDTRVGARAYPPSGSVVEMDVAWLANDERNLAGYDALRSEVAGYGYRVITTMWDPNATFLADTSPDLGVGKTFFYGFKALNLAGTRSSMSESLAVKALPAIALTNPAAGGHPASPVTLRWQAVSGVGFYGVFVFSEAPDYDTTHQGSLVWANEAISSSSTSIAFGHGGAPSGAHLVSGQSYYAVLYAGDGTSSDDSAALTFSPIVRFVAP
jgi:hypothetical protein